MELVTHCLANTMTRTGATAMTRREIAALSDSQLIAAYEAEILYDLPKKNRILRVVKDGYSPLVDALQRELERRLRVCCYECRKPRFCYKCGKLIRRAVTDSRLSAAIGERHDR
jgi:hypothetical protein